MASLRELIVKISADSSNFQRGIAAAQKQAVAMAGKFETAGSILTRSLSLPIAALGGLSLRSAAQFDSLERGLRAVAKSSSDAEAQMVRLRKVAELPGLGFREAVQGSINLQAAGFSAQTAERALKAFGNALATVGKGRAELDGVITALSQIQSKGKVSAEEINQLAERLPQIRVAIQDAFGTADTEAIQKLGITTEQFIEKVIAQFEKLPVVTGGLGNSFENLRDKAEVSLAKIGNAISPAAIAVLKNLDPLIERIGQVAQAFSDLPTPVQTATLALAGIAVAAGPIANIIKLVYELRTAMLAVAGTSFGTAVARSFAGTAASAAGAAGAVQGVAYGIAQAAKGSRAAAAATEVASSAAAKSIVGIGTAATGAGAATFLFLDKLNDYAVKTSTADQALGRLNERFREFARQSASSESAVGKQVREMDTLARSVFDVGKESANSANNLSLALAQLNTKAPQQLKTELEALKSALDTVRAAYKAGQVDLATLNSATKNYNEQVKALGVTLAQKPTFLIGEEYAGRATALFQRVKEEVADFQTAFFDAEAAARRLALAVTSDLNPAIDTLGESLRKVSRDGVADALKLNSAYVTLQAQIDATNQSLTANRNKPLPLPDFRTGTVLETSDILNGQSQRDLQQAAERAGKDLERLVELRDRGSASQEDVVRGQKAYEEASRRAAGVAVDGANATTSAWKLMQRQVSTVVTDLSRGITDIIAEGGKVGEVFRGIGLEISKSMLRFAIEQGVNLLIKSLGNLIAKVFDVGKAFNSVFGGISSAASGAGQAAGAVGNAAGSAANAAGAAASAAVGGALGAVGAISGAVTAVFSALSYLNSRRMEQDIGRIEVTSREIAADLANLRTDEWNRFGQSFARQGELLSAVRSIYEGLGAIDFSRLSAVTGATGAPVTINMSVQTNDADVLMNAVSRRLRSMDRRFSFAS